MSERASEQKKTVGEDLLEKYHQLQSAHFQLEDDKVVLKKQLKKIKRLLTLLVLVTVATAIGISGYFWQEKVRSYLPAFGDTQANELPTEKIITVKQQTLRNTLSLTGKIEPLDQIEIVAPLEGMVQEKNFQYGEFVEKNKVLLVINTAGEQIKYREAQAAYLEASAKVDKLKDWENSPEVASKRRELSKAEYSLKTTLRKLEETRRLLEKGIVAAAEVEELEDSYHNQQLDKQLTKEQLASTLQQGSKENLLIAELKQTNALVRMQSMKARIQNAQVVSPIDGVVLLPPERKEGAPVQVQSGSFIQQDQVLFTVADLRGFNIRAGVDEVDILQLQLGQQVTITSDAFEENLSLTGTVNYISSQANKGVLDMPSVFTVSILVSAPPEEQKKQLLLGMSTDMEVLISEKTDAFIVPFSLVTVDEKEQAWVTKFIKKTGKKEKIKVKTGITSADTVEIIEGLQAGDQIISEAPAS
ncbi:MAG: HlyD family efflux transporter periplasmic adaptor subunit [Candidatus Electrothrix sp. AR3]|nr:HlyD family efflux transporter periplasmic adaptor subunit [Candidatus Electrothrix sp. AR3]